MPRILSDGLLSLPGREAADIATKRYNGSKYGEEIYTGGDVSTFTKYGDVDLLVALSKGVVAVYPSGRSYEYNNNSVGVFSTVPLGTLVPTASSNREILLVLQQSSQYIPLMQLSTHLIVPFEATNPGNRRVHEYHVQLQ
jgi:hypothetical protein